jgi:Raf kinase inhibitor-like YbhB/YbcL family protein
VRRPASLVLVVGIVVVLAAALVAGCGSSSTGSSPPSGASASAAAAGGVSVSSSAFKDGGTIPARYTCAGDNVSPPLSWSALPEGTADVAVTVVDQDAPGGTFVHWVAAGLPPRAVGLPADARPPLEGRNDFGTVGYRGPCPPRGSAPHRYRFTVYALRSPLSASRGFRLAQPEHALAAMALATGTLVATYKRA